MAPTPATYFSISLWKINWRNLCKDDGITILYNMDGRLLGSRSKSFSKSVWNELQFADDISMVAKSQDDFAHSIETLLRYVVNGV